MSVSIVILAAGQGKRMRSQCPKVLHRLAGRTLLEHVVATTVRLNSGLSPIVIYGHQGNKVRQMLAHLNVTWVEQPEQLGTGNALLQALPFVPDNDRILVLYGDVPLISYDTLQYFITQVPPDSLGIVTTQLSNPSGFGRIVRDAQNKIVKIVEEKDASEAERLISEINSGIYLAPKNFFNYCLPKINNNNTQKEFYLTDIVAIATKENTKIFSYFCQDFIEMLGVNDLKQLAQLERYYQLQIANKLMEQGVTLADPNRLDVRGELNIGTDVFIDVNVIIEGKVTIGNQCSIGPNVVLRNVTLANQVEVRANSIVEGAEIAEYCMIGPFARIRPGTLIANHAQVGNFIEVKNSRIGPYTKAHHVSYLGDSEIGGHVNIGAGTITCNYDGVKKHKTIIEDNAFIGSNTELVAPVRIGTNAIIGAGSTITHDAPADQLTLSRVPQRTIEHWQRKTKETKE